MPDRIGHVAFLLRMINEGRMVGHSKIEWYPGELHMGHNVGE
jgi:hypothetical protein